MQKKIMLHMIFLFLFWAVAMFCVKYRYQKLHREFLVVQKELQLQQQDSQVFRAEYAYLSSPSNLAALANKYLHCKRQTAANFDYLLYKQIYGHDSSIFKVANNNFLNNN